MNKPANKESKPGRGWLGTALKLCLLAGLVYICAPLALTVLVGQQKLRENAELALRLASRHQVNIEGETRFTVFPWFGLSAEGVSIKSEPGFESQELLHIERAGLKIKLWPLITRQVYLEGVRLSKARLNLERDAMGRVNWRGLAGFYFLLPQNRPQPLQTDSSTEPAAAQDAQESLTSDPASQERFAPGSQAASQDNIGWNFKLDMRGVRIDDSSFSLSDRFMRRELALNHVNLRIGGGDFADYVFSAEAENPAWPLSLSAFSRGVLRLDPDGLGYAVRDGDIVCRAKLKPGRLFGLNPEKLREAKLESKLSFDSLSGDFSLHGLDFSLLGAHLAGDLTGRIQAEDFVVFSSLSARSENDSDFLRLLSRTLGRPGLPELGDQGRNEPGKRNMVAELSFSASRQGLDLKAVSLYAGQSIIEAKGSYLEIGEPKLDLRVSARQADLDKLLGESRAGLAWIFGDPPQNLRVSAAFEGKEVRLFGERLKNCSAYLQGKNGSYRVYPFSAELEAGVLNADLRLGRSEQGMNVSFDLEADPRPLPGEVKPSKGILGFKGQKLGQSLSGRLSLQNFDYKRLLGLVGQEKPEAGPGLAAVNGRTGLAVVWPEKAEQGLRLEFSDLALKGAEATLSGKASLELGRTARLEAALSLDRLDMDKLLAKPDNTPAETEALLAGLSRLGLGGSLAIGKLNLWGQGFEDCLFTAQEKRGKVQDLLIAAKYMGSKISGSVEAEPLGGQWRLGLKLNQTEAKAERLSQLFWGREVLRGAYDLQLAVESTGSGKQSFLRNLKAQAELKLNQGQLTPGFSDQVKPGRAIANPLFLNKIQAQLKLSGRSQEPQTLVDGPKILAVLDLNLGLKLETPHSLRLGQLDLSGALSFGEVKPLWLREAKAEGSLRLDIPFAERGQTTQAGFKAKGELDFEKGGKLSSELNLELGGIKAKGRLDGPAEAQAMLGGHFEVESFVPRFWMQAHNLEIKATPESLNRAKASFDFNLGSTWLAFKKLSLNLDNSNISGQAGLYEFADPIWRLDLGIDRLDMDQYQPKPKEGPSPALGELKAAREARLNLKPLRDTKLEAKFNLGWLRLSKLIYEHVRAGLTVHNAQLAANLEAGDFYGGTYQGEFRADARDDALRAQIGIKLKNSQAPKLLDDLAEVKIVERGRGDFELSLGMSGVNENQLRRSAQGHAWFVLRNGRLSLSESQRPEKQSEPAKKPEIVEFSQMDASFLFRGGVGRTENFRLIGNPLNAVGKGEVDLAEESMDFNIIGLMGDTKVPLSIKGPISGPKLEIDRSKILGDMVFKLFDSLISIPGSTVRRLRNLF